MRTVAVAIVAICLVALVPPPAAAADECATPGSLSFCVPIALDRPNPPQGIPPLPQTPYWGKYYLWIGAGHCLGFDLNDCRGFPATSPGVFLPDGTRVPTPGIFGVLYQESNGVGGLQRFVTSRVADRMVLV